MSELDDPKKFTRNMVECIRSSPSCVGTSFLQFRHILRSIHKSLSEESVPCGVARDERISLSLCSSCNKYVHTTYSDYLTSTGSLIRSLFDANLERMFLNSRGLYFPSNFKQRNCASECDLSWSPSDNLNAFPLPSNASHSQEFNDEEQASSRDVDSNSHQYPDEQQCPENNSATVANLIPGSTTTEISLRDTKNETKPTNNDVTIGEQPKPSDEAVPDVAQPPSPEMTDRFSSRNCVCPQTNLHENDECVSKDPVNLLEADQTIESLNGPELNLEERNISTEAEVTQSETKLHKSVLFADEVGQSLTETFVIHREDSLKSYDYDYTLSGSTLTGLSRAAQFVTSLPGTFRRSRLKNYSSTLTNSAVVSDIQTNSSVDRHLSPNHQSARIVWSLMFPQPASKYYEFRQRIESNSVSLENISVTWTDDGSVSQLPRLSGTIKVKNLSFEKQVWIRLTTDNWKSYTDHMALYSPELSSGMLHPTSRFDTFTFQLAAKHQLDSEQTCDKVEFAIRYLAGPNGSWGQYWDNNGGKNYIIERTVVQPIWSSGPPQSISHATGAALEMKTFGTLQHTNATTLRPYTSDFRPNFDGFKQFTDYRAWDHFSSETTYY